MKNISRTLLTTAFAAASLMFAAAAHAQTPTVITSLPYVITSPGNYVLNSNLNSSQTTGNLIEIKASNVTIDFQNHYIAGAVGVTGQTANGVYANEQSNLTVKNGIVAYCRIGIYILGNGQANTNSVDHQVDNMRITYCYYVGAYIIYSPASRITNCQISQIGYSGASSGYGVIVGEGAGQTVQNCVVSTVTATSGYGILATTASCFVRKNTVSNCTYGVFGGKYQDDLTFGCTNPFSGGTDAGRNN